MYLHATDLAKCDPLPDENDVVRYCKPSDFDSDTRELLYSAFTRKRGESDLSVNRLQFFCTPDRGSAVDCVRQEFKADGYDLKPNGRFVVFGVYEVKAAALETGHKVKIIFTPKPSRPSHTSIFGLPSALPEDRGEQVRVAIAFLRLITPANTYQAVPA